MPLCGITETSSDAESVEVVHASKARPVVIIQSDKHTSFDSVILCLFTSFESSEISTRVLIKPSVENGLQKDSYVMTDKIVTVDRTVLGKKIGFLLPEEMDKISTQLKEMGIMNASCYLMYFLIKRCLIVSL